MSSPIICEGLSKRFRRTAALADLHLEVPEGSIYALIGPNGAGKSTLIKMLVNLLRPTGGRCLVLGRDSRQLSPHDFAQIGYVSENLKLPEWMTVDQYLAYLKPFYPTWDDAVARELLGAFQLAGERRLSQLSRGMKMKAALASSLAYRPRLIVMDEPFSGLDPLVRDELIEGLLERASDTTILVCSHDLTELESFSSHVGFLEAGHLMFSEETSVLTARFRDVQVILAEASVPPKFLANWLNPRTSNSAFRFVDSRFNTESTASEISALFPQAKEISINPMSLREIFVALAKRQS